MTVFVILFQASVKPKAHWKKHNIAYIDSILNNSNNNSLKPKLIYAAGIVKGQIQYSKIRNLFDSNTKLWIDVQCLLKKKDFQCILFEKILQFKTPITQIKTCRWPSLFDVEHHLQDIIQSKIGKYIDTKEKIIFKALVVDQLWLSLILSGQKFFETRSQKLSSKIKTLTLDEIKKSEIPLHVPYDYEQYSDFLRFVCKKLSF